MARVYATGLTKGSMEVERNIRSIQEHGLGSMKTMVNLGSDVYVHAKVYVSLLCLSGWF